MSDAPPDAFLAARWARVVRVSGHHPQHSGDQAPGQQPEDNDSQPLLPGARPQKGQHDRAQHRDERDEDDQEGEVKTGVVAAGATVPGVHVRCCADKQHRQRQHPGSPEPDPPGKR